MLAADLLTVLLVAGIVVLIISTTIMAMNFAPRARRRRRRSGGRLSDTAAHTLALAEADAPALIRDLVAAGVDVYEARSMTQSLERVFMSAMGGAA